MITMQGNTTKLWRYRVDYEERRQTPVVADDLPDDDDPCVETARPSLRPEPEVKTEIISITEYATSNEHLDAIKVRVGECTVTPIDQTGNEWIDGMEFQSRDEAVKALEMGEATYQKQLRGQDTESRLQTQLLVLADALAEMYERTVM